VGTKGVSRENIEIYQITSLPSSSPAPAHYPNQIIGCMTISTSRIRMTKLQKYRTSVSCVDLHVSRTFLWNYNTAYPKHHSCPCRRPTPGLSCTLTCSQTPFSVCDATPEWKHHALHKCTFSKARSSILLSAYSSRAGAAIINLLLLVLLVRQCSLAARSPLRACTSLTLTQVAVA